MGGPGRAGPGWEVSHLAGPASSLLATPLPGGRQLRFCRVSRPALVLGRAQPEEHVDRGRASARGVEVARRPSGGGAVLVRPGEVLWADLGLERHDPLWSDLVDRAAAWVGGWWSAALADLGLGPLSVHRGPMASTPWSAWACFSGRGPGEVSLAGAKVVGIAQRRSPRRALFQCACLLAWEPWALVELLRLDPDGRQRAALALASEARGTGLDPGALEAALVRRLP
ncbi:MAG TPA: hypothetical protein VKY15_07455 [Acidimicrobiales bacterium]|nr:hypothetical protein [Acidimicrobiales bacterium]